jgi:Cytochrome P460
MHLQTFQRVLLAGTLAAAAVAAAGVDVASDGAVLRSRMAWPSAFPQGFERYRSAVDGENVAQGWANSVALAAAARGLPLPEGSIIVVSHHRLEGQADGSMAAGPARSYDTMELRAGWGASVPQPLRNGDWDYAQFDAVRQRRDGLNQAPCLACHQPLAARSHVFTWDDLTRHARGTPPR